MKEWLQAYIDWPLCLTCLLVGAQLGAWAMGKLKNKELDQAFERVPVECRGVVH